jgi:hypothetical protein
VIWVCFTGRLIGLGRCNISTILELGRDAMKLGRFWEARSCWVMQIRVCGFVGSC